MNTDNKCTYMCVSPDGEVLIAAIYGHETFNPKFGSTEVERIRSAPMDFVQCSYEQLPDWAYDSLTESVIAARFTYSRWLNIAGSVMNDPAIPLQQKWKQYIMLLDAGVLTGTMSEFFEPGIPLIVYDNLNPTEDGLIEFRELIKYLEKNDLVSPDVIDDLKDTAVSYMVRWFMIPNEAL